MRRRAIAASVLASMGILTAGWQIGAATAVTTTSAAGAAAGTGAPSAPSASSGSTTAPPSAPASASAAPSTSSGGLKDGRYTGASEQTRYGDVQVEITVSGGKIADVTALKLTDQGGRSVQISSYASPILRQEVLSSQSANVANVSGATYTTGGYLTSLQSALDQAKS